jgi:dephospho-CoA kinase
MIVLGLSGSIGMGKSTALGVFRRLGAAVHDADAEVHRLLGPGGAALSVVLAAFPAARMDGGGRPALDRRRLGALVFGQAAALARLEAILHPAVRQAQRAFIAQARRRRSRLVVLDVPLLFETGGAAACDATVVVSAPLSVQRARVLMRPGMTAAKLRAILSHQMSDRDKRRHADFVIPSGLTRRDSLRAARAIERCLRAKTALPGLSRRKPRHG